MYVIKKPGWAMPERSATPEHLVVNRRHAMGLAAGGVALAALPKPAAASDFLAELYPAPRNERFVLDRPLTDESVATSYNNFYEFGSHKQIARAAQRLQLEPWEVVIDGLVEREIRLDAADLIRRFDLEERLYRLRCVEAWAMAVPWTGFPLKDLVAFAKPLGGAKYLRMETFLDPSMAPGQRQFWYPWPYVEGLTMAEATNELSFIATGMYGRPIPRQNGAPLRLAVPWKYGFKSIKSIRRFTFTAERPLSFWEELQGSEYGFWANVNPEVPHPRWSQAEERMIGTDEMIPTQLFNGYGEFVAHLYEGMADERLFM
ncbi:MAG: protein-methionine-sulfoxide reductase catalytic subunit MsrP [Geminicoccaceae bacterium]|nr:MAG: protein-methionine-sulfoxide reductase catalytic subunit MsrP [Geminicoccaceae bacterium]